MTENYMSYCKIHTYLYFEIFDYFWTTHQTSRQLGALSKREELLTIMLSEDSFFSKDKAWMPKTFPEQSTALTTEHDHFREFFSKAILAS